MTALLRFLALVSVFVCTTAHAAPPTPYRAEYEVLRNGEPLGRGTVSLRALDDGGFELHCLTRGTEGLAGLAGAEIEERSVLSWADERFETREYRYRQNVAWKTRERHVTVDAAAQRIHSQDRDRAYDFDFEPGVLDRQGVILALIQDVAAGKRGELSYTVVDRDEFGPQRYRVGAEERVQTPAGQLRALRVERVRAAGSARSTTSWLGLDHGFLPVRMVQREPDGDSIEMRLISVRMSPVASSSSQSQ